jgi:glycosyltransferase involved in cell wall biosynthesis
MKKVLFLVTELQKPVGGLYRFASELLPAWKKKDIEGCDYEPFVLSMRDPSTPLGDLKLTKDFPGLKLENMKLYEAIRGGMKCYFIENSSTREEQIELQKRLWDDYRIKSMRDAFDPFYQKLNSYWIAVERIAPQLNKELKFSVIDAQDWLAFPAGFNCKKIMGIPLVCRFHSGEFGRSLGKPDSESAPLTIETAALQEADHIQGVSVHEAKFEIYNLLPLKQEVSKELKKFHNETWWEEQQKKDEDYELFLEFESENDLELITSVASGVTNGINLDEWSKMDVDRINFGKTVLKKLMPNQSKIIIFIGRADWRKGIDVLIEAFAELNDDKTGLIIASSFDDETYKKYHSKIINLGIEKNTLLYNGWLAEDLKKSLFTACDILALPSLYEPFGLVTLEGLAADLACENNGKTGPTIVVGDTGGMHEIIKNGVNGFKVPMNEFELKAEYLSKILKIILNNEKLRKKISNGGARRVQTKFFDWDYIVEKIFEEYAQAIANYEHWHGIKHLESTHKEMRI